MAKEVETPDLDNREIRRCPAIMLAANRIAKVRGRIRELVSSIPTIKGMRAPGVPRGNRWASIRPGVFNQPQSMWPSQRGSARVKVNTRWLEAVKM